MREGLIILALTILGQGLNPLMASTAGDPSPPPLQSGVLEPQPVEEGEVSAMPAEAADEAHGVIPPAEIPFPWGLDEWNAFLPDFYPGQQTNMASSTLSEPAGPSGNFIYQNTS
ncbi:MAG: hypothetical protein GX493_04315, partial [Firmicutes bacterium]|nr:hypothetical protein [Bacillota bacterium]